MKEQLEQLNQRRSLSDRHRVCHAPFNNIFIGNRGYVMACCFNKLYLLGRYPAQSILEIWEGEKANQLRVALSENNFKLGCQNCALLIEEGNFDSLPARVYDGLGENENKFPQRMEFELDNTCNLECIMCSGELSSSIRERREKKPPILSPYGEEFLNELDEFIPYLKSAQFLGGEPFLISVYFQIWERMMEINPAIKISIQTNGTILNSRVKRILEKLPVSISISMDGISKDVYEKIRVNADFDRVKENATWFNDYCKSKQTGFSISYCPMPQNWSEIPLMVSFCNFLSAPVFFNSVFYPPECSMMNLPAAGLKTIVAYLKTNAPNDSSPVSKKNLVKYYDLINQLEVWANKELNKEKSSSHVADEKLYDSQEELLSELYKYCEKQDGLSLFPEMKDKLNYMLQRASEDDLYDQALENLLHMHLANLYDTLPDSDIERLYMLFKERVLKIVS